jgi:AcrR family transcriptional regulator
MGSPATTRRSQVDRRAEAISRLLEATVACGVEVGYTATTVSVIEERAGVSRGRRVHYFERKEDLILAAVDYLFERRAAQLLSEGPVEIEDPGQRIDAALERIWEYWQGEFSTVVLELRTAARTDPSLRAALQVHEDRISEMSYSVLGDLLGPDLSTHPDFVRVLVLIAQAMNGLAQTRPVDHDEAAARVVGDWKHLVRRLLL